MSSENYYLYKITNLVNGKLYIGITAYPEKRKRQHLYEKPRKGRVSLIKLASVKYGAENFSFEVLCVGKKDYILDLEVKAIAAYDTISNGYNISRGGEGSSVGKVVSRSDDYDCFVSGFWFPNKRTACETLEITNTNVFYTWKKLGVLGDVCKPRNAHVLDHPTYFKGFWFDSVLKASEIYNKPPETIRKYILLGKFEEDSKVRNIPPKRKPVINGITYNDLREASLVTSVPYNTLRQYFYQNKEGYSYEYTTN